MKVKNKTNHKMSEAERAEKKFDRDLKSCMKCHYFWGNDSRCMNSQCYKEKKAAVKPERKECKRQVLSSKKWKLFSSTFWQIKSSTFAYSTLRIIRRDFLYNRKVRQMANY